MPDARTGLYLDRALAGRGDHRGLDLVALAGHPVFPRERAARAVLQEPDANRAGPGKLRVDSQGFPPRGRERQGPDLERTRWLSLRLGGADLAVPGAGDRLSRVRLLAERLRAPERHGARPQDPELSLSLGRTERSDQLRRLPS